MQPGCRACSAQWPCVHSLRHFCATAPPQRLAEEFETRTDSLAVKVQVGALRWAAAWSVLIFFLLPLAKAVRSVPTLVLAGHQPCWVWLQCCPLSSCGAAAFEVT